MPWTETLYDPIFDAHGVAERGALTLGMGAIIAVVALVTLSVQGGLALARSVGRMFTTHRVPKSSFED